MRPSCRRNAKSAVAGETPQRSSVARVAHTASTTMPVYVWIVISLVSDAGGVGPVAGSGAGGTSNEITSLLSAFDSRVTGGWSKLAGGLEFVFTNGAGGEKVRSPWRLAESADSREWPRWRDEIEVGRMGLDDT